jgi:p-cumate 2,3-dioxygenase beta subunit
MKLDMEISVASAHAFLAHEAELLDTWRLLDWAALFDEDGEYLVPTTDLPDGKADESLYLIYDNRHRLEERAKRLLKRSAHAEFPRSRTLHTISNVVVRSVDENLARVACCFVAYRSKGDKFDIFPGRSEYKIRVDADGRYRIREKRSVLALETLRPQNKLSIIL